MEVDRRDGRGSLVEGKVGWRGRGKEQSGKQTGHQADR